jgi:hypothetical protein
MPHVTLKILQPPTGVEVYPTIGRAPKHISPKQPPTFAHHGETRAQVPSEGSFFDFAYAPARKYYTEHPMCISPRPR